MNITRYGRPMAAIALAASAALVLSSCAANEEAAPEVSTLEGTLVGAGSSAQGSAQEAWIAAFQTANPGVTITYDPTGSGAGRETFIAGGSNFAGSDSYLKDEELAGSFAACVEGTTPFEIPNYVSPIAVIFNIDGVDELNLDAATIAGIFKGTITKWNDPAIVAMNKDANLPDAAITAVHRSDDSGTTKNFSDYLLQNAPEIWDIEKAEDPFPYQSGEGAQGTSGVVDAVKNGSGTIGYADASKAGSLGIAKIKVGNEFVAYTPEAAAALIEAGKPVDGRDATDMAVKIDRTGTDPSVYPIALVSYLIGCNEYKDPAAAELVKSYFTYILSEQGQLDAQANAGSAPLTREVANKALAIVEAIK
ncbi:MAG: Phosphate-binding protein PstS 3 precursor [Actinomycetota bacterium]